MNKDDFARVCREYADGTDFQLNQDKAFLASVIGGVMKKQEQTGLRYCPCRIGTELELLCPCFFQAQEKWEKEGMCWCGLFVKK